MPAQLVIRRDRAAVYELLGSGDEARIEAMLGLYQRLFPQYQHYVQRMRRRARFGNELREGHVVHYWLVEVDGQPAGIRTFRYVRKRHCGLAHALAVAPEFRDEQVGGRRLSVFLIYECLAQVIRDSSANGGAPALGIVNEVETHRLMEHYERNGLIQLPLKYKEPIFLPEVEGRSRADELSLVKFSPMRIGFLPNPNARIEIYSREMLVNFILAFLTDHYGLPETHPVVLDTLNSIQV
jgi:GNAT superfamily N-acetyltransferase